MKKLLSFFFALTAVCALCAVPAFAIIPEPDLTTQCADEFVDIAPSAAYCPYCGTMNMVTTSTPSNIWRATGEGRLCSTHLSYADNEQKIRITHTETCRNCGEGGVYETYEYRWVCTYSGYVHAK